MNTLKRTGKQLLFSSDTIDTLEAQQGAFLSAVFILLMIFSMIEFLIGVALQAPEDQPMQILRAIGIITILPIYLLSRRGYYQIAARIFVLIGLVAITGSMLAFPISSTTAGNIFYLILPMLVAGLTLNRLETIIYLGCGLASAISVLLLRPELPILVTPLISVLLSVIISVIGIRWFWQSYRQRNILAEQRYQDLVNASLEGIIVIDTYDARILDANAAFEALIGQSRDAVIGHFPLEFLTADTQPIARKMFRTMDQNPHALTVQRADGTLAYIEAMLRSHIYAGKPALVIVMRDITARMQAERALQESEQLFRAVFDNSSQLTGILTPDGTIKQLNAATLRFFNVQLDDAIGRKIWEIPNWNTRDNYAQAIQEMVAKANAREIIHVEIAVIDHSGQKAYIDFRITPVVSEAGEVQLLLPEARDITARFIAEKRRTEYERRYEALFRSTADAVFIIGLDGKVISVNDRGAEMLRREREAIIGQDMTLFIAPDERTDSSQIQQRLASGETISSVFLRKLLRQDGEEIVCEVNAMLVRDANNRAMYIQSMLRDVSERQKLQQQEFELRLQRARANLLQRFIDEASHYFRTPIANIKNGNYLIPRFSKNPEKQQEQHRIIERELQRLENLLDSLLLVTRLQKDDSGYQLVPVMVTRMLSEVRSHYEGRTDYTQHQWNWQYTERDTVVIGDKQTLSRCLQNIIDNAIRYTPAGGLIMVRSYDVSPWTVIEISDTGMGISETDLPHIFEDFYRGAEAMSRDSTGSGLGLSISYQVAERHRGALRASSRPGSGSTFQVILPINRGWDEPQLPLPLYNNEPDDKSSD